MSVWILRQALSFADEENIHARGFVALPFENLPDLSRISEQSQLRALLSQLYPDSPPESLLLKLDRLWGELNALQPDDTVAVPLPHRMAVAIARVSGRYEYHPDHPESAHRVPVEWYQVVPAMASFGKFRPLFENPKRFFEVTDKDARIKIHDKLPHRFNRFAKWKWLLMLLVAMQAVSFVLGLLRR